MAFFACFETTTSDTSLHVNLDLVDPELHRLAKLDEKSHFLDEAERHGGVLRHSEGTWWSAQPEWWQRQSCMMHAAEAEVGLLKVKVISWLRPNRIPRNPAR